MLTTIARERIKSLKKWKNQSIITDGDRCNPLEHLFERGEKNYAKNP